MSWLYVCKTCLNMMRCIQVTFFNHVKGKFQHTLKKGLRTLQYYLYRVNNNDKIVNKFHQLTK